MDTASQMATSDGNQSRLVRILVFVPRILASKPHIILLTVLGVYLVVLPLLSVHVSAFAELVGGNYTNVTSDLGACIAAGGTIHLIKSHREHRSELAKLQELVADLHRKLDAKA
jgi:predicted phage tail protein